VVVSEKSLLVIMFKPSIPEYFRKVVWKEEKYWNS
jgi:hypothetical protein